MGIPHCHLDGLVPHKFLDCIKIDASLNKPCGKCVEQVVEPHMDNGRLRDELLNRDIFTTLLEAQVLIADWKDEYNHIRLHSSLGYKTPVPETYLPVIQSNLSTVRH